MPDVVNHTLLDVVAHLVAVVDQHFLALVHLPDAVFVLFVSLVEVAFFGDRHSRAHTLQVAGGILMELEGH